MLLLRMRDTTMDDGGDFGFGFGDDEPYPYPAPGAGAGDHEHDLMSFAESPALNRSSGAAGAGLGEGEGMEEFKLGDSAARRRPWLAAAGSSSSAKNAVSEVRESLYVSCLADLLTCVHSQQYVL